jgi:tripartite-type tricarboxylate transporter receptor subunit TctC
VLMANPKTNFKDFKQFADYARANPGKVSLGFGPAGGLSHLLMALFKQQTGIDITFVPYKGEAPVVVDMLGGVLDMTSGNLSSNREYIRSGKIVPLAVASPKRSPLLPDVPTFIELGYPAMVSESWSTLMAPAGTPREVITRLNEEIAKIQRDPAFIEEANKQAAVIKPTTPEEARAFIQGETEKWGRVVVETGVKAE